MNIFWGKSIFKTSTHRQRHAVVLFVGPAASEECNDEDETANYDQEGWHAEELWIQNLPEVVICTLHGEANGHNCDTRYLQ